MGLLGRNKENENEFAYETTDYLIIFNDDTRTSDIQIIDGFKDNAIVTANNKIPIADCDITTGRDGRNFFYRAPAESVKTTENLAELEKNMVLSQITAYRPPEIPNGMDLVKWVLSVFIVIAIIALAFT